MRIAGWVEMSYPECEEGDPVFVVEHPKLAPSEVYRSAVEGLHEDVRTKVDAVVVTQVNGVTLGKGIRCTPSGFAGTR